MAKTSQVLRDKKRIKLIKKYAERRAALRKKLNDANVSVDEKLEVQKKFAKMPRNSCPTRLKRRCAITGRSRGNYRKFGLGRTKLREATMRGDVPGLRKASW